MPRYYPMMMDVKDKICLVVGGGEVAARKAEVLLKCGAKVRVVSPELDPLFGSIPGGNTIEHIRAEYGTAHIDGVVLAIAATDNEPVNRSVYRDAVERNLPVNVVDVPDLCTFIVPSIVESGDLLISISTSGKSPAFAKRIRKELEGKFGPEYGRMLELMGEVRDIYKEIEPDLGKRMKFLSDLANSDLLDRVRGGETPEADEIVKAKKGK